MSICYVAHGGNRYGKSLRPSRVTKPCPTLAALAIMRTYRRVSTVGLNSSEAPMGTLSLTRRSRDFGPRTHEVCLDPKREQLPSTQGRLSSGCNMAPQVLHTARRGSVISGSSPVANRCCTHYCFYSYQPDPRQTRWCWVLSTVRRRLHRNPASSSTDTTM